MGSSPDIPHPEKVAESKSTIGESHSAPADDIPKDQVTLSKEDPQVKATAAEQSTSLKDYFVRHAL